MVADRRDGELRRLGATSSLSSVWSHYVEALDRRRRRAA